MPALALPVRPESESFHELMAEQLRRAPWFALSMFAHACILLAVWALFPAPPPETARQAVAMAPIEEELVVEPPVIEPPEPIVEPVPTEVDVPSPTLDQPSDSEAVSDAPSDFTSDAEAPSDTEAWNVTLGLTGPPFGGPRGRGGPGGGAPRGTKRVVEAALQWLARHQDADGRWDADGFMKHDLDGLVCDGPGSPVHDVGVTALALLAFVGDGNSMRSGPYREQVRRAANWLREQQGPEGRFGPASSSDFVYDHVVATYAMCELYGYSQYRLLAPVAQRGVDYLQAHRNPYGAWRYQPRDNDNDTSVTTWATFALVSGDHFGLEVNKTALQMAAVWYDQVTDDQGRAGYTKAGERSSRQPGDHATRFPPESGEAMTAAALAARQMLGQTVEKRPLLARSAALLQACPPQWQPDRIDPYYWYMGTLATWQFGGEPWQVWSQALAVLPERQRQDGNFAGSWDPIGVWDLNGGRIYATALYALTLRAVDRAATMRR